MDSIITEAPHQGGWFIFSNHHEVKQHDEQTGEDRISYVADAVWQADKPN